MIYSGEQSRQADGGEWDMKVLLMSRQAEVAGGTSTKGHVINHVINIHCTVAMKHTFEAQYLFWSSKIIFIC